MGLAFWIVLISPPLSWLLATLTSQHGRSASFAVRGLMRGIGTGLAVATLIVWSEVVSHIYVRFIGKGEKLRKLRNVGSMVAPLLMLAVWLWDSPLLGATHSLGHAIASSTVSLQLLDGARLLPVASLTLVMTALWISVVRKVE